VEAATGCKKSTIYLLIARKEFPPCVRITPRMVAWPESLVLQWVQDRIAGVQASARGDVGSAVTEGGVR
jgi:prophage regulatory protein